MIFTNASSKCQRHWMKPRMCATRLLHGEHWAKPIPPEPDRLVANVDPALGQAILDVAQRQRKHRNGLLIILNYQTWSRTKIKSDTVVSLVGFLASNRGMDGLQLPSPSS